jgi:hypothetical protein
MSAKVNNYAFSDFILINTLSQNRKKAEKSGVIEKGFKYQWWGDAHSFVLNQNGANLVTPSHPRM